MHKIYLWFIPHKHNKFHPHALRPIGLTVFLVAYLLLPPIYNATAAKNFQVLGYATNVTVGDVHAISNQQRASNGVAALTLNSQLNSAAASKANDMMTKDYWAHNAPDGTTPWAFITANGYTYAVAAENLAKGYNTSSGVVTGWMNSAGHRANLLSGSYKDVGYAVLNGVLQGTETTLVVAMYASKNAPAPAPAPVPTPAPAPAPAPSPKPAPQTVTSTPKQPTTTTPAPQAAPEPAPVEVPATPEPVIQETPVQNEEQKEQQIATIPQSVVSPPPAGFASVAGAITMAPIEAYTTFNWSQKASIVLLCTLILLFIMKHTIIWRQQKRGVRNVWLRSHPLGQAMMLFGVLLLTLASSAGAVL